MVSFSDAAAEGTPEFTDLAAANREIGRLKTQLYHANMKWRDAVERNELVKRSLMGQLAATVKDYGERLIEVKNGLALALIERDQNQRRVDKLEAALQLGPGEGP